MSVFQYAATIIDDYKNYVCSFFNIADERIRERVEEELFEKDLLWPEALIQLNPGYETAATVKELCAQGSLHPLCGEIFCHDDGRSLTLYHHQQAAIECALRGEHFVVTSGTGSGKTLTYLIPIFNAVLRDDPGQAKVRAIIVYPMNALVNSQYEALERLAKDYRQRTGQTLPVRFAKYTGQEEREERERILKTPPHILLTNYVMLELMLVRPHERPFVDKTVAGIEFLVFDELHTYRGRQGADVALLIRRLRERCGNPEVICIGTSATMVSGKEVSIVERRQVVASFASKIFGVPVSPENIIEERFRLLAHPDCEVTPEVLRACFDAPLPETVEEILKHPLTWWIEQNFGVSRQPDGSLWRCKPITLTEGAQRLALATGLEETACLERLREMLIRGSRLRNPDNSPVFALKLHQFVSQGSSVYATLEPPASRYITLEGRYYAPHTSSGGERLLYPVEFCRVCGQAYYDVWKNGGEKRFLPREPENEFLDTSNELIAGYLVLGEEVADWTPDAEHLPPEWLDDRGRIKSQYRKVVPQEVWVRPDGTFTEEPAPGAIKALFQPKPFMLCVACGEFYTGRDKYEFRKLARLSSEGRSSATTVMVLAALLHAEREGIAEDIQRKVLSFTDNRQDASLQAGHFNDFVRFSLLRAALYQALETYQELYYDNIADKVLACLGLELRDVASNPELDAGSVQGKRVWKTFRDLVEYRLYEDLQRGWRVIQPNLEQCGLLQIDYLGLAELCADEAKWEGCPPLAAFSPQERYLSILTLI